MAASPPPPEVTEALLAGADSIGLFPSAAIEIFEALKNKDIASVHLAQTLRRDPVLAGRLLKVANSSFYGRSRRVRTLEDAVLVLGFNATRDMAVSFALLAMSRKASPASAKLWRHMLSVGALAAGLARRLPRSDPAAALVVGMMHDLGSLLLLEVEPHRHAQLLMRLPPDDYRLITAERMIFGIDHATLGAACMERWGLPPEYADIVRRHHTIDPEDPPVGLGALVQLADMANVLIQQGFNAEVISADLAEHTVNRRLQLPRIEIERGVTRLAADIATLTR